MNSKDLSVGDARANSEIQCNCTKYNENPWKANYCSCLHKKSDHDEADGMCTRGSSQTPSSASSTQSKTVVPLFTPSTTTAKPRSLTFDKVYSSPTAPPSMLARNDGSGSLKSPGVYASNNPSYNSTPSSSSALEARVVNQISVRGRSASSESTLEHQRSNHDSDSTSSPSAASFLQPLSSPSIPKRAPHPPTTPRNIPNTPATPLQPPSPSSSTLMMSNRTPSTPSVHATSSFVLSSPISKSHTKNNLSNGSHPLTPSVSEGSTSSGKSRSFLQFHRTSSVEKNDSFSDPPAVHPEHMYAPDPTDIYMRMLFGLVKAIGLNPDERVVKELLTKAEAESRSKNRGTVRFWMSSNMMVEGILDECVQFAEWQAYIRNVVIAQSAARRYLSIKRYKGMAKYLTPPYKERNQVLQDIIKIEQGYITKLNILIKNYLLPLRALSKQHTSILSKDSGTISPEEVRIIFSNVELMASVHEGLLASFHSLMDQWPAIENIGQVFLSRAPDLKVYGEYVSNFKTALGTLTHLQNNPKFSQFLEARGIDGSGADPGLMPLISVPLNQISNYSIQLQRLEKVTPSLHPDYGPLLSAEGIMTETYTLTTQAISQSENKAALVEIQKRLMVNHLPADFDLLSTRTSRSLKAKGPVQISRKNKHKQRKAEYYYFLFTDILLLCKPNKNQYKPKEIVYLKDCVLEEDQIQVGKLTNSSTVLQDSSFMNPFCICVDQKSAKNIILLSITNAKEREKFMLELKSILEILHPNKKVFGAPLGDLLKPQLSAAPDVSTSDAATNPGVPIVIDRMVYGLMDHLDTEGLFRISCNQSVLVKFKADLDAEWANGTMTVAKLDKLTASCEPHVIANALKALLRELPEPIIPFTCYEPLMAAADMPPEPSRTRQVKDVLAGVGSPNREVLRFLVKFLCEVAQRSKQNKMTPTNLAILFGPNVIRPRTITIETTLSSPKANVAVEEMITNCKTIFD